MTPSELIEKLGGTAEVARLLGCAQNTVGNWLQRRIPAWAIPALTKLCEQRGIDPGDGLETQQPRRASAA